MKTKLLILIALASIIGTGTGRADPLDTWTLRNPLPPTAKTLQGIVYGGGQFVAVGAGGIILCSSDATNWVPRQSPTASQLWSIAYGDGQFVAVGDAGTIVTSSDGVHWIQRVSKADVPLLAVAYGGGQFVAGGNGYDDSGTTPGRGTIVSSADGVNWVERQSGKTNVFYAIAYGNGLFVAVGTSYAPPFPPSHGLVMTSVDGVNWSQRQVPVVANDFSTVTYANGRFWGLAEAVFPTTDSTFLLTSADGTNWMQQSTSYYPFSIAYGNGWFVGTDGVCFGTSADADQWVLQPSGLPDNEDYTGFLSAFAYGSGQFVAVGDTGAILTSIDGANWVRQEPKDWTAISVWDIAYGNDRFVAVGERFNNATGQWEAFSETSADGSAWESHVGPGVAFAHSYSSFSPQVAYGNGSFIASGWSNADSGPQGQFLTSTDGLSWTPRETGTTNSLGPIAYGNGRFVALGGRTVAVSTNGVDWVQGQTGAQHDLSVLAYGNGQFVAMAMGSFVVVRSQRKYYPVQILTSTDGLNWVEQRHSAQYNQAFGPTALAYGNGQFVAVGSAWQSYSDFIIRGSSQGLNWVESETTNSLNVICYGSGFFVAVSGGNVASSHDGATWTQRSLPGIQKPLRAIAYGNGHFVAVGPKGTFLQSGPIFSLELAEDLVTALRALLLEGPTGVGCTIQSSADLISWHNLTNVSSAQKINIVLNPQSSASNRFYRAFSQ